MARGALFGLYAVFAVIGALVPYTIFIPWLRAHGMDVSLFTQSLFATGPAAIFSTDALLSSAAFLIFMAAEGGRLGMRKLWLPPLLVCVFGLCCAFPAFLAMRERALDRQARGGEGAA